MAENLKTDTIKTERKNCKMIAHRGLSGIERENTCAAFVLAGSRSYYGIETDVHVTADGKFIICHDDNLVRVSGTDMIIEESAYSDIKNVKITDTDGKTYRSDLVFPDLVDYVNICKKYNKRAVLELKNRIENKKIDEIVKIIKDAGYLESTTFISFDAENLVYLRSAEKDADIQFLTGEIKAETIEFLKKYGFGLDAYFESVNKNVVDELHSANLKVNCWTVDDKTVAERLISYGVDFITTNILE